MEKNLKQQKSNCLKVVVFGPESSGKTTLSKQLAAYYKTNWVPEYSRQYAKEKLINNQELTKHDVLPIAQGQISLENRIAKETSKLLICDTDLLETKVYSEYIYNYSPKELITAVKLNTYDLYILTNIDIPWERDAVRNTFDNRKELFSIFKEELESRNLPFILVSGEKKDRLNLAIAKIDSLLLKKDSF